MTSAAIASGGVSPWESSPTGTVRTPSTKPATTASRPPAERNAASATQRANRATPAGVSDAPPSWPSSHASPDTVPRMSPDHATALTSADTASPRPTPITASPAIAANVPPPVRETAAGPFAARWLVVSAAGRAARVSRSENPSRVLISTVGRSAGAAISMPIAILARSATNTRGPAPGSQAASTEAASTIQGPPADARKRSTRRSSIQGSVTTSVIPTATSRGSNPTTVS